MTSCVEDLGRRLFKWKLPKLFHSKRLAKNDCHQRQLKRADRMSLSCFFAGSIPQRLSIRDRKKQITLRSEKLDAEFAQDLSNPIN
jgi:hypothetical protein